MSTRKRKQLMADIDSTMRLFMAHAVVFQDAVAKHAGMNSTDLQCANLLLLYGPATAGELAERVGLTTGGAITTAIDRLERAGMIERTRDPADRRRVLITAKGDRLRALVGPVYQRIGKRWAGYLAGLDEDQLTLANELFAQAAMINKEETSRLRDSRSGS